MHQPHKLVKHTQTIRRVLPTNCLSVFDDFVGLVLKGLITILPDLRRLLPVQTKNQLGRFLPTKTSSLPFMAYCHQNIQINWELCGDSKKNQFFRITLFSINPPFTTNTF